MRSHVVLKTNFKKIFTVPFVSCFVFLSLYLSVLLTAQSKYHSAKNNTFSIPLVLILLCSIVLSFGILKIFSGYASKVKMCSENRKSVVWGLYIFAITLSFFVIYLMGQYPGGFTYDSVGQYNQAMGKYNYIDWHPVLHTLLFFTLPLKTGLHLGFVVLWQLILFSLAFGYISYVMHKNGCPKFFLIVMCAFTWLNPFMATYMMFPWKDIGFTIFSIVLMAYYIQILCSKGQWLLNYKNAILFSVVSVVCMFMRHNAVLFVGPFVVITLLYCVKSRKFKLLTVVFVMICFGSVKLTYSVLNVVPPDKRIIETVGMPATIWCNVMKKNPQALPEETRNVFYRFATQEEYETKYSTGDFNSIKWEKDFHQKELDKLSYGEVIHYTMQCLQYAPNESIEAFAKLTSIVWAINAYQEPKNMTVVENEYGFESKPCPAAKVFVDFVKNVFSGSIRNIVTGSHGFHLLVLLIIGLLLLVNKRTSILHLVPIFCYNFGTMLLLSGDDYRFFLLNIPLLFPLIFVMFKDKKCFKKGNQINNEKLDVKN